MHAYELFAVIEAASRTWWITGSVVASLLLLRWLFIDGMSKG